ncbi:hypothetical protein AcW1_004121 [Taiwanofungus camphoratus]|nr:hypothetical protein AcV5_000501 [Antrodia cinnamomea]KAI0959241.1 hypothetical protein AcW1_004121 [Antrodia cinnamomea]
MSQPPPYSPGYSPGAGGPPTNPDRRELPLGWIAQYDSNHKAWFYVNTCEDPPRSSWTHPLGPPPSSPRPSGFAPPLGPPPPDNRGYSPAPYSQGPPGGYGQPGYNQGPPSQQWEGSNYGRGYGSPAPQGGYGGPQGGYGGPPPGESRGWFGGGASQPPAPVEVIQAPPKKKHGMGMGTAIAAGGIGLLGGALLAEGIEHHDEYEREVGFDQGYQDGEINQASWDDGGGFGGDPGFF